MLFKSVATYLEALRKDPALAMIPLGMVAEWKGISRSAVSEQIRTGRLEGLEIRGERKTWRAVTPLALFTQTAERESVLRERRAKVLLTLTMAAAQGRLLPYGEVMAPAGMSTRNPRHRGEIGALLSDLSRQSLAQDGWLISALVVQKGTGRPNALFFALARDLGCMPAGTSEDAFWRSEVERVFSAFRSQTLDDAAQ